MDVSILGPFLQSISLGTAKAKPLVCGGCVRVITFQSRHKDTKALPVFIQPEVLFGSSTAFSFSFLCIFFPLVSFWVGDNI